jgi:hypothetical protein
MSNGDDHGPDALRETSFGVREPHDVDIDVSLLEDSLRLSPWQRLVENDRALGLVRMLEQAGARLDGTTHSNP